MSQTVFAVDTGNLLELVATRAQALDLAAQVLAEYRQEGHPFGDLWARQLVSRYRGEPEVAIREPGPGSPRKVRSAYRRWFRSI